VLATAEREDVVRLRQFYAAASHPRFFLPHLSMPDSRGGNIFHFATVNREEAAWLELPFLGEPHEPRGTQRGEDSWLWQRDYVNEIVENPFSATLKARQLGVSWIHDGLILWDMCFFAGIDDLIYSIKEDDAIEQVNRVWDMWLSVPGWMKALFELKVIKPYGDARPTSRIELEHPDDRLSTVTGMASTKKAGHSRVARRVLMDEGAHNEFAKEIWKAITPATADAGGNVGIVSTANGMGGIGEHFYKVYTGAGGIDYPNVRKIFLPWDFHPDRTQEWYDGLNLDTSDKAEQYPENEDEAFLLTGNPYFDMKSIAYYLREARVEPLFAGEFVTYANNLASARFDRAAAGEGGLPIEIYRRPEEGKKYAIGVDTATGDGEDFSVGAVIDLTDGAPCAELRMKDGGADFTRQLHFLGNYYRGPDRIPALIGVEDQGGYGKVVIAYLRDGHEGRKAYLNLYRHREYDDRKKKMKAKYGFPMNSATRPKVVAELKDWVNKRLFPFVTRTFAWECRTFVRQDTRPSPRAAEGNNDDVVMAWGIALELYSAYGEHAHSIKKKNTVAQERQAMKEDPRPVGSADPRR